MDVWDVEPFHLTIGIKLFFFIAFASNHISKGSIVSASIINFTVFIRHSFRVV